MIRFAENLNKMITAGLGGAMEAPSTEVAVGHRVRYLDASGPVASFETNIAAPLRSLRVDMLPIQAGSGDPSPDNIRPITGRDRVIVWRESAYDPSADPALTVQLGRTVYAGTVDVTTGTLTINKVMQSFDNSTLYKDNGTYKIWMKGGLPKAVSSYINSAVSNITKSFGNVSSTALETRIQLAYGAQISAFASIPADFNIADVEVCYELASPLTIQLTPAQLTTLKGDNNVWSDAGDVTLEYSYYEETEGY